MNTTDIRQLEHEVRRYLAAVEVFRREGCEPRWAAEAGSAGRGERFGASTVRLSSTRRTFET